MGPVGEASMVSVVDPDAAEVPPEDDVALQAETSVTAMTPAVKAPRRRHLSMSLPAFMVVLLDLPGRRCGPGALRPDPQLRSLRSGFGEFRSAACGKGNYLAYTCQQTIYSCKQMMVIRGAHG